MNPADFPLPLYLKRIGLARAPAIDENGLKAVHAAQAFSIPFENLDIHLGRPISLKPEDLIDKLLGRNRGGYCFELNQLFRMALAGMGFSVRPVLARVLYQLAEPGPLTHEALIVTVSDRKWLCDTGFGGPGLRRPMPLAPEHACEQYGELYRLRHAPDDGWILQKKTADEWIDLYMFLDLPVLEPDIEMSNHFTSTWPGSYFRRYRMCALPTSMGRITLLDMELTQYEDGRIRRKTLQAGPGYMDSLLKCFGIDLKEKYEDFML